MAIIAVGRRFMIKRLCGCIAASALLTAAGPVSATAAVIDHVDVAGYGTFQDLNTGRVWLDLDNFFSASYVNMEAAASAAGFTVATRVDVEELLNSWPLSTGLEWPGYATGYG